MQKRKVLAILGASVLSASMLTGCNVSEPYTVAYGPAPMISDWDGEDDLIEEEIILKAEAEKNETNNTSTVTKNINGAAKDVAKKVVESAEKVVKNEVKVNEEVVKETELLYGPAPSLEVNEITPDLYGPAPIQEEISQETNKTKETKDNETKEKKKNKKTEVIAEKYQTEAPIVALYGVIVDRDEIGDDDEGNGEDLGEFEGEYRNEFPIVALYGVEPRQDKFFPNLDENDEGSEYFIDKGITVVYGAEIPKTDNGTNTI